MKNATKATVSVMGAIVALAGLEHGVGEILQGNVKPDGMVIMSWQDPAFAVLGGEPAMTIVPSLLASGVLSILVSVLFLMWATLFIQRKHGGLVLILLSVILLLVGGGFGPPILGIILGTTGTKVNSTWAQWSTRRPGRSRRILAGAWGWFLAASVVAWLIVFPGLILIDQLVGLSNPEMIATTLPLLALGSLLLAILSAFARDSLAGTQTLVGAHHLAVP